MHIIRKHNSILRWTTQSSRSRGTKIASIFKSSQYLTLRRVLLAAFDRQVLVRYYRDMSCFYGLSRGFLDQVCGSIHRAAVPEGIPLAGGGQSRLRKVVVWSL